MGSDRLRDFPAPEKQRLDRLTHSQGLLRTVAVKGESSIGRDGLIGRLEVARLGVSVRGDRRN